MTSEEFELKKDVQWTLGSAVDFCRFIQPLIREGGYHCGLTGSSLIHGESTKDVDILIYPHDKSVTSFIGATMILEGHCGIQGLRKCLAGKSEEELAKYPDDKDIWIGDYKGKRVDFFFVQ